MSEEENTKQEEDHSIEDILASIRNIISEEDEEAEKVDVKDMNETMDEIEFDAPEIKPESTPSEDVADLELTDSAPDVAKIDAVDTSFEEEADDDILELTEEAPELEAEPIIEEIPEEPVVEEEVAAVSVDDIEALMEENLSANEEEGLDPVGEIVMKGVDEEGPIEVSEEEPVLDEGLISDAAATSAVQSLSKLSETISTPQEAPSSSVSIGTISLDEIVRQEVRPLVKEWLDDNLPSLVERLVEKEISKLRDKL